jgi:hypothetical protein
MASAVPSLLGLRFFCPHPELPCANLEWTESLRERGKCMKTFFSEKKIEERFSMIFSEIEEDVKRLDLPEVAEIGRQKSIESFYRRYSIGHIELEMKRMKLSELKKLEVGRVEKNGRPVPIYKSHVIISIPYIGPESLFDYIPTRTNGPAPTGDLADGNVVLSIPIDNASDRVRREVESLAFYADLINHDAKEFNKRLIETIERKLDDRRREIEREHEEYQKVEAFVQEHNKLKWS